MKISYDDFWAMIIKATGTVMAVRRAMKSS